jgi:hypothetical protein
MCVGYRLTFGDHVVDTRGEWWVRAFSQLILAGRSSSAQAFPRPLRMMKVTPLWRVWNSSTPSLALRMEERASPANYNARQRVPKILVPSGTSFPISQHSELV